MIPWLSSICQVSSSHLFGHQRELERAKADGCAKQGGVKRLIADHDSDDALVGAARLGTVHGSPRKINSVGMSCAILGNLWLLLRLVEKKRAFYTTTLVVVASKILIVLVQLCHLWLPRHLRFISSLLSYSVRGGGAIITMIVNGYFSARTFSGFCLADGPLSTFLFICSRETTDESREEKIVRSPRHRYVCSFVFREVFAPRVSDRVSQTASFFASPCSTSIAHATKLHPS